MKADRSLRLLAQVKNGVNHLSEKLQHIKAVSHETMTLAGQQKAMILPLPLSSFSPSPSHTHSPRCMC